MSSGLLGNGECDGMNTESERSSDTDLDPDVDIEKVCRINAVWTLNTEYYITVMLFTGCRNNV